MPISIQSTPPSFSDHSIYGSQDHSRETHRMKTFTGVSFTRIDFRMTDFTGSIFVDCAFTDCDMTAANLSHVMMRGCMLERCTMDGTQTDYLRLYGCQVMGSRDGWGFEMAIVLFENCFFENTDFTGITLTGCTFLSSILKSVTFTRVLMASNMVRGEFSLWDNVTFRDSIIQRALFHDAMLFNIRLLGTSKAAKVGIDGTCTTEECAFLVAKGRKCKACGNPRADRDFYKLDICKQCAQAKGYSQKNTTQVGKKTKLPSFSVEFEVQDVQPDSNPDPVELVAHDWVVCNDASVQAEYKSPIYRDMVAFSHVLSIMDGCKGFVGDHCGTHIHVEMRHKDRLQNHYSEIFNELEAHCMSHTRETIGFWGRFFNSYACSGSPGNRYAWINTSSEAQPTVEFRLCKFTDAQQFKHLLKFARSLVRYLDEQLETRKSTEEYAMISKTVVQMYQNAVMVSKKESN